MRAQPGMAGRALVAGVSTQAPVSFGSGPVHVAVVDYGCKRSIVRRLVAAGASVTVYPHGDAGGGDPSSQVDGVLLSNGPGYPAALPEEVDVVRGLVGRVPLLGICLGHQLLGLALGLRDLQAAVRPPRCESPCAGDGQRPGCSSRCRTTASRSPGEGPEVTYRSLYDETVEGLALPRERLRSVQFHPEAAPGPHDAWPIVESWVDELRESHAKAA